MALLYLNDVLKFVDSSGDAYTFWLAGFTNANEHYLDVDSFIFYPTIDGNVLFVYDGVNDKQYRLERGEKVDASYHPIPK
jgi:hypothetical protein